jgi:hypothetical protein
MRTRLAIVRPLTPAPPACWPARRQQGEPLIGAARRVVASSSRRPAEGGRAEGALDTRLPASWTRAPEVYF